MRLRKSAGLSILAMGFLLTLVFAIGSPGTVMAQAHSAVPEQGTCNEWAGYHWHSFGCHAHPGTPHMDADESSMMMSDKDMMMEDKSMMMEDTGMDSAMYTGGPIACNAWAGYHWHSFGCHAHPGTPHTDADEVGMMMGDKAMSMSDGDMMAGKDMMMSDKSMMMDDAGMDSAMHTGGPIACNAWAGYHWHSFGCHAHPGTPHTDADEVGMMMDDKAMSMSDGDMMMDDKSMMMDDTGMMMDDTGMDSAMHTGGPDTCNAWAGYHWHSFGCHAHPGTPHTDADEVGMMMGDKAMSMSDGDMMMADKAMDQ